MERHDFFAGKALLKRKKNKINAAVYNRVVIILRRVQPSIAKDAVQIKKTLVLHQTSKSKDIRNFLRQFYDL